MNILVLLLAIPITAIIDYFVFRNRFKKEMGEPLKWYYFLPACALELGCFYAGYLYGSMF